MLLPRLLALAALVATQAATPERPDPDSPKPRPTPAGPIVFEPFSRLGPKPFQPEVLGGRVADPADYPASFFTRQDWSCTASLVGPKALLTAGHCVNTGVKTTIRYGNDEIKAVCEHDAAYPGETTADWALCLLSKPITGVLYEMVNQDPARVKLKDELRLTGFGCNKAKDKSGGGVLREGDAEVVKLPRAANNDIVTKGDVALCYGDSGGPAFYLPGGAKAKRWQVAVNSRGNIKNKSYLSSTSTPAAQRFLSGWARKNKAGICGLTRKMTGCRILR